jgi:UDP-N-acetylmuramate dehydrogenase
MSVTEQSASLRMADHTTLRVGGPARRVVAPQTVPELIELVGELDAAGEPVLVLGGGSNLLVGDDGFDGTAVKIDLRGIQGDESGCAGAIVTVAAGENWDDFVAYAIDNEWSGVEALSGIPGLVGATPIQNVGAYGSEVSQTIQTVRTLDRRTGRQASFPMADCAFSYRSSRFKTEPGRYVVLSVTFQFRFATRAAPIRYAELARTLGVEIGARPPAADVRAAVLGLRRSKGMVLDEADHDTWSAGSFFTNPVLDPAEADTLPPDAPRWPQPDGTVKTSAAWLIEHAGFGKGFGTEGDGRGAARLSGKHPLALTNRGSATAADIVALARAVRARVRAASGITLVPEPVLIGCSL